MINVFGASFGEEELREVRSSLESGWTGMGPKVKQFEEEFSKHIGRPSCLVDSGSNALYLATQLLNLKPCKIIVPSFTWVSCASAVVLAGHQPVFADVDLDTHNITPETIAPVVDEGVGALMVVHYAGLPVDAAVKQFNLPIIEDCAHAVDSGCGHLGDVAIFSFDSVKNLATPEGGGLAASQELVELAKEYRYCGVKKSGFTNTSNNKWWEHDIQHVWPKMLPNDISASFGLAQLRKLPTLQQRRRQIWDIYQRELNLPWLTQPVNSERHSYFTYLVRVLEGSRDNLAKYLLDNSVYTTLRYHPLHMNPIYGSSAHLPNCELLNEQGLNLPLHPRLSDEDVYTVIDLLKRWPRK